MALLTYFAAHWMLASGVTLAVIGLGVAAYVLKNAKFALAAIALAVAGFFYQGAVTHGIQLQLNKEIAQQNEILKEHADTITKLGEENTKRAIEDAIEIQRLETEANETPANSGIALDRDAARRVRNIK